MKKLYTLALAAMLFSFSSKSNAVFLSHACKNDLIAFCNARFPMDEEHLFSEYLIESFFAVTPENMGGLQTYVNAVNYAIQNMEELFQQDNEQDENQAQNPVGANAPEGDAEIQAFAQQIRQIVTAHPFMMEPDIE
ncbi:hypothetical protein [Candidatus Hydrogenosomobacter endosymbioticus]|nr:hypothetical protein [Candidatus Hydrogenosomobacter endosymbioticus]